MTSVALCPATEGPAVSRLAAFIPEAKGSPASAGIYSWAGEGPVEPQPIVKKSFFRTQGEVLAREHVGRGGGEVGEWEATEVSAGVAGWVGGQGATWGWAVRGEERLGKDHAAGGAREGGDGEWEGRERRKVVGSSLGRQGRWRGRRAKDHRWRCQRFQRS